MNRPKPTRDLIDSIYDYDTIAKPTHYGLQDFNSLHKLYPNLDFSEVLTFLPVAWELRKESPERFGDFIIKHQDQIYNIFKKMYGINVFGYENIFEWLNSRIKKLSYEQKELYNKLNPFGGKNLMERLDRANNTYIRRSIDQLLPSPKPEKKPKESIDSHRSKIFYHLSRYPTNCVFENPEQMKMF